MISQGMDSSLVETTPSSVVFRSRLDRSALKLLLPFQTMESNPYFRKSRKGLDTQMWTWLMKRFNIINATPGNIADKLHTHS